MKQKKSASILKKFLIFNLTVFSVLGLFTIIYLEAIQPTLVNERSNNHKVVINNTKDNLERLGIEYTCLLYTTPSPRDEQSSRMPSSA